jgi:diadenosine tetraphosphatase ApaH/serine/threonine PP2A family protein phosphatase
MYTWTADNLSKSASAYLRSLPKSIQTTLGKKSHSISLFHGSPAAHHEFLFDITPDSRFLELAGYCGSKIIVTGHSHTPYHKFLGQTHFINPGSVGRMFDGDPRAAFAVLTLCRNTINVDHYRIPYNILETTGALTALKLPEIYSQMFLSGTKLN